MGEKDAVRVLCGGKGCSKSFMKMTDGVRVLCRKTLQ